LKNGLYNGVLYENRDRNKASSWKKARYPPRPGSELISSNQVQQPTMATLAKVLKFSSFFDIKDGPPESVDVLVMLKLKLEHARRRLRAINTTFGEFRLECERMRENKRTLATACEKRRLRALNTTFGEFRLECERMRENKRTLATSERGREGDCVKEGGGGEGKCEREHALERLRCYSPGH
jgi:hypothetical protein